MRLQAFSRLPRFALALAVVLGAGLGLLGSAAASTTPAEDAVLKAAGLLGPEYTRLAGVRDREGLEAAHLAGRAGLHGPFSADFGDPDAMLVLARFARVHPDMSKLFETLQRGDVLFITQNQPGNIICAVTGGPFTHVLLCTDPHPPGRFIEAVGVTSVEGDPCKDRVRRSSLARYTDGHNSIRLVRPTMGWEPARRAAVVEGAIKFATAQLGKPYNYAFSDREGGDRAYYCSSLIFAAYRAGGFSWPVAKAPERDRLMLGIRHLVLALGPDDPVALAGATMAFMHRDPRPRGAKMADFLLTDILPHAHELAPFVKQPASRARLRTLLTDVFSGRPLPPLRLPAADDPAARAEFRATQIVTAAAWPYADDLATLFGGRRSPAARTARQLLDTLDSLQAAGGLTAAVPTRAPWVIDDDFESPTDLAWAPLWHQDYLVLPGEPLGPPWRHALIRARKAG